MSEHQCQSTIVVSVYQTITRCVVECSDVKVYLTVRLGIVLIVIPSSSIRCTKGSQAPLSAKLPQLHAVLCFMAIYY